WCRPVPSEVSPMYIPGRFDAWDIDLYYQEKPVEITELVAAEVEETGPLRATLRLQWRFYDSTITQRISIYRQSRRIDFRTEIDWQERQILLKTAFPVAIRSTRATYDIQFGAIERATHWNTSWDYARFEVVGHKWADLSEGNYGVSLLNDCKYGYDIKDNVIRLTLLKSAIDPDPTADLGRHEFTYSLLPHGGIWQHGDTLREGYALNMPLIAAPVAANPGGPLPAQTGFASVTGDGVIIETVKQAEDARTWIVRVYEGKGYRQQGVALAFARPIRAVNTCNLVEEGAQPYPHEGDRITFDLRPYEIRTFEVSL
ncbi:MAG TPA: glycoside hydrolase family 38 C-terminal domain-containing protein, partial [Aggregatilineales bacterium]|nr:glycoside hydrolase family 38 C-terminal domain-containing protein [Aggregatilineales bacterium]